MLKKLLSFFLVITMGLSILSVTAFSEDDILEYLEYEIINGEVTITDCDESISGEVVIPDTIEGYPVTILGNNAFSDCHNLESVVIPGSIKTIGRGAFGDSLESLTQVTISEGVTTIGDSAFYGAPITKIVIPSTVTSIGEQAFNHCTALTDISILSEKIEKIGFWAFQECGYYNDASNWENGILYIDKYMIAADSSVVDCVVKDGTIMIADYAFYEGWNLETIEIADSVTTIGSCAFYITRKLEKVVLPKSLKKCNDNIFVACDSLMFEGIILPDGIEIIPANLYNGCSEPNILNVVLPESVKEIADNAFKECITLNSISLSENVEFVGENAFTSCLFLDEITLYNKEIVLEEKAIGYTSIGIVGDKAEFEALCKEVFDLLAVNEAEKAEEIATQVSAMMVQYDEPQPVPNFTIYGYKGSTSETYANKNNFNFVAICEHNYVDTVITPATYSQSGEGGMVCEYCGDIQSLYEIPCLENDDSSSDDTSGITESLSFIDKIIAFFVKIIDFFKNIKWLT